MLPLFSVLLVFVGHSLASPSSNQYVDTVLHTALQNVIRNEKLDPTHLPDYTYEYKDKTFIGNVNGKAEYSEGKLVGLSKVQRYSDCDAPRNVSGSTVINCTLTFYNLTTSHKGKVKYGVLPKATIQAKGFVQYTIINASIFKLFNGSPSVRSITFRSFGSVNTTFTGLGPLNGQMKVLEKNYQGHVGAQVPEMILTRFQYALNLAVPLVPMPLR